MLAKGCPRKARPQPIQNPLVGFQQQDRGRRRIVQRRRYLSDLEGALVRTEEGGRLCVEGRSPGGQENEFPILAVPGDVTHDGGTRHLVSVPEGIIGEKAAMVLVRDGECEQSEKDGSQKDSGWSARWFRRGEEPIEGEAGEQKDGREGGRESVGTARCVAEGDAKDEGDPHPAHEEKGGGTAVQQGESDPEEEEAEGQWVEKPGRGSVQHGHVGRFREHPRGLDELMLEHGPETLALVASLQIRQRGRPGDQDLRGVLLQPSGPHVQEEWRDEEDDARGHQGKVPHSPGQTTRILRPGEEEGEEGRNEQKENAGGEVELEGEADRHAREGEVTGLSG